MDRTQLLKRFDSYILGEHPTVEPKVTDDPFLLMSDGRNFKLNRYTVSKEDFCEFAEKFAELVGGTPNLTDYKYHKTIYDRFWILNQDWEWKTFWNGFEILDIKAFDAIQYDFSRMTGVDIFGRFPGTQSYKVHPEGTLCPIAIY